MRLYIGTSGFSYKEWKGNFYPSDLPAAKMLEFYASKFNAVEINNTFYRMPGEEMLAGWQRNVPESFRFVLKVPRRITHQKKLVGVADDVSHLHEVSGLLGPQRGPYLVQLPPYVRGDLDLLRAFFGDLPDGFRCALETRHESWHQLDTARVLTEAGHALCVADVDDAPSPEWLPGGSWGYLRLRRTDYDHESLSKWAERIRSTGWSEVWIFLKHEDEGKGPRFAMELREILEGDSC